MNKNVKRIIALALVFGTVSAVAPATHVNLLTTKAYATDENGNTSLDSLSLETSSGSTIKLYSDSDYDSDSRLDESDTPDEDTYYAKTSSSTININTDGPNSRYVKVFKGTSNSTKGKSISSDISLSSGTTTLVVRVYYNKPDSDVRYDDDSDVSSEYKIKVKYTGSDLDTEAVAASDYDDIYLDRLSVDGESISLSESKINYSYNVASNVDKVTIKAAPKDEDYDTVTIDGSTVDHSDYYKKTVSLDTGDNKIKIEVEDDNSNYREYTLNIIKGTTSSTSTNTTNEASPSTTTTKYNQWVQVNGKWQYNDALGNPIRNMLFNDRNYGKTYYLQADGNMATGWINTGGKWYYFGTDGAMLTGWIIDGGKYYYLYSDGSMASNTTIGLYKLGTSGAWVK
jgi:glucan-binding YG repeat protein